MPTFGHTDSKNMNINTAITVESITTGIGFTQIEEVYTAANI